MARPEFDVVVVGAGAAGLAAAAELDRAGMRVCCVEARYRIGGRIHTVHDPFTTVPIELGAEFVHGQPPVLIDLVRGAGLALCEIPAATGGGAIDRVMDAVARRGEGGPDESFQSFLDRSGFSPQERRWSTGFVEGFNAARKEEVSVAWLARESKASHAIQGHRAFRVVGGYGGVPLALHGRVRLNTVVEQIEWNAGEVAVRARSALDGSLSVLRAPAVLLTVPLGVLHRPDIAIEPAPAAILEAARRLRVGNAIRVTLRFDRAFWEDRAEGAFLFSDQPDFPTWWTAKPVHAPVIVGWSAGPNAAALQDLDRRELISRALRALAGVAGPLAGRLEAAWFHDWQVDPFSRGAYCYVPAGALPAQQALTEPVEGTLFFAGEATDTSGHTGTVHGAIASGKRASAQIRAALAI